MTPVVPKSRWLLHLVFWILFNLVYLLLILQVMPPEQAAIRMAYASVLSLTLAYINWFYLIPRLFYEKKYISYFLITILIIFCFSWIRVWIEDQTMNILPQMQQLPAIRYAFILFSFLIIWILSSLFRLLEDFLVSQRNEAALKTGKLETELKLLKAQINPHFLFNTLNNIYSLVYLQSDQAAPMLLKLSGILRYMLYEADTTRVPITREIEYLKDAVDLHLLNPADHDKVKIDIVNEAPDLMIEPLLFINFLENSFKHGSLAMPDGYIHLCLTVKSDLVDFSLENSRIPGESNEMNKGIGLNNIRQRLQLLYPGRHVLDLQTTEHSFNIRMILKI